MGDKGKNDKGKRDQQKKGKQTVKEKRKRKKINERVAADFFNMAAPSVIKRKAAAHGMQPIKRT